MILVFDSETTGKFINQLPDDHPSQPRLVSLAAVCFSDDGTKELSHFQMIAKPDGFVISPEVTAVHGISHERAMEVGIDPRVILITFFHLHVAAKYSWAFNISFDDKLVRREARVHNLSLTHFDSKKQRCVMLAASNAMKLPNEHGYESYAWPKLGAAYKWFFGVDMDGAHNSFYDTRATGWLGIGMRDRGLWNSELQG